MTDQQLTCRTNDGFVDIDCNIACTYGAWSMFVISCGFCATCCIMLRTASMPNSSVTMQSHNLLNTTTFPEWTQSNQKMHYFPISPNFCFCTTCGNRKRKNCTCSLKCCMSFCQQTRKTHTVSPVTAEPPFTDKTIDCVQQTGPRKGAVRT